MLCTLCTSFAGCAEGTGTFLSPDHTVWKNYTPRVVNIYYTPTYGTGAVAVHLDVGSDNGTVKPAMMDLSAGEHGHATLTTAWGAQTTYEFFLDSSGNIECS